MWDAVHWACRGTERSWCDEKAGTGCRAVGFLSLPLAICPSHGRAPQGRTENPTAAAALRRRSSKHTSTRCFGRSRHHTSAAASCAASGARRPWVSGISSASDRTFSVGSISSQAARNCARRVTARARSSAVRCSSRASRAKALRASSGVPHHTTMRFSSRCSRRPCTVARCEQQRGTMALASQKATSAFVAIAADSRNRPLGRDKRSPRFPE